VYVMDLMSWCMRGPKSKYSILALLSGVIKSGKLFMLLVYAYGLSRASSVHTFVYTVNLFLRDMSLPGTYPVLCAYSIFCQKKDFSHFWETYS